MKRPEFRDIAGVSLTVALALGSTGCSGGEAKTPTIAVMDSSAPSAAPECADPQPLRTVRPKGPLPATAAGLVLQNEGACVAVYNRANNHDKTYVQTGDEFFVRCHHHKPEGLKVVVADDQGELLQGYVNMELPLDDTSGRAHGLSHPLIPDC